MLRVDGTRGNVHDDPALAERIEDHDAAGTLERLVVPAPDRHKSRFRAETEAGTDLGVVVDDPPLRAGDVLVLDDERAVVVAFERREALVVDLPDPSPETLAGAVEFGHRVGNQHWDIAVRDGTVYVPVEADHHIVEDVLDDALPPGARTHYELVDAALWVGDGPDADHGGDGHHDYSGGHPHSRSGGDGDDHTHAHGDDHTHAHGDDSHTHGDDDHTHAHGGERQ